MSIKISPLSNRRLVSLANVPTRVKLFVWTIAAALPFMGSQTVSQPKCDVAKIAEGVIAKHFSFYDSTGMKPVISESNQVWEFTYQLPRHMLGGAPVITIDKQTCAVVRIELTQ